MAAHLDLIHCDHCQTRRHEPAVRALAGQAAAAALRAALAPKRPLLAAKWRLLPDGRLCCVWGVDTGDPG